VGKFVGRADADKGSGSISCFIVIAAARWIIIFSHGTCYRTCRGMGCRTGRRYSSFGLRAGKNLDEAQIMASARLLNVENWIDSFSNDGLAIEEENSTRATIKFSMGYSRNDEIETKPQFYWRLKLSKLSRRAQPFISASEDEDFDVDSDPISGRPVHGDSVNNELIAGLKWFFKESEKYNISFDTGASWDYLFAGLRFRAIQDDGSWQERLTEKLRYYISMMAWETSSPMSSNGASARKQCIVLQPASTGMKTAMVSCILSIYDCIKYSVNSGHYCTNREYTLVQTQVIK